METSMEDGNTICTFLFAFGIARLENVATTSQRTSADTSHAEKYSSIQSDRLTNVTPKRYLAHYIWLDKLLLFEVYSHGKPIQ